MRGWFCFAVCALLLSAVALAAVPSEALAGGRPAAGAVSLVVSGWGDRAGRDWNPGPGFALTGRLPVTRQLEVRADVGGRWLDGADHAVTDPAREPRWGGQLGERSRSLRMIPVTFDLVHHLEKVSKGRFWIPYIGGGPGFYDIETTWTPSEHSSTEGDDAGEAWVDHHLFKTGWHLRGGVEFHRVSGMYLDLGTAVHFVGLPGRVSPHWEVSLGLGSLVPGARR